MAHSRPKPTLFDEVVIPVISFLTLVAGILGLIGSSAAELLSPIAILTLLTSLIAVPAGILLYHYQHLGWLMTLVVIGVSELLVLTSHVSTNNALDPTFFLIFTAFYAVQAYYLVTRRELFDYPNYHPRHQGY